MYKTFTRTLFVISFLLTAFSSQRLLAQNDYQPKYLTDVSLTSGSLAKAINRNDRSYDIYVNSVVNNVGLKFTTDPYGYLGVNGKVPKIPNNKSPEVQSYDNQGQYYIYAVTDAPSTVKVAVWYVHSSGGQYHSPAYNLVSVNYTFTIHRLPPTALLANIAVNGGEMSTPFDQTQQNYTISSTASSITLSTTAQYPGSTVTVNDEPVTDEGISAPIALSYDAVTNIVVKVTTPGKDDFTYNLSATRQVTADLKLSDLSVNAGTVSPTFSPDVYSYDVTVPLTTNSINVTPTLNDTSAVISINNTPALSGSASADITLPPLRDTTITLAITAKDSSAHNYTLNVVHAGARALLSNLISSVQFDTAFTPTNFSYTASVNYDVTNIILIPVAAFTGATLTFNGIPVASNEVNNWPLESGINVFTITVTGTDSDTKTYTLTVIRLLSQTITFAPLIKSYGDADFAPATASSALPVTYTSSNSKIATIVNNKVHIVSTGTVTITATQKGDQYYLPAQSVTQTISIRNAQTISFTSLIKNLGDADFAPATASSKLALTYTSSNVNVANIVNGKVHIVGAGTATITATQGGNSTYSPVSLAALLTVNKTAQTIIFIAQTKTYGDADFAPATASSKLPVIYTSSNVNVATIVNGKVHIIGVGTATITATQAGNSTYGSVSLAEVLTINKAAQTITFTGLTKTYGDADFAPATASSKLALTYTSSNANVVAIVAGKVHIIGAGTTNITAIQAGDNLHIAKSQTATLTVNKAAQTITFAAQNKTYGDADFAPATSPSKLAITYASSNVKVASVISGKIHIVGAGIANITASQPGNANYSAAKAIVQKITVAKAQQVLKPGPASKTFGDADFAAATISTGLPLTYIIADTKVASVIGGKIHIRAAGVISVVVYQAGNGNYESLTSVLKITVAKAQQVLKPGPASKTYGDADFAAATVSTGLPLTYIITDTKMASVIGGKIHIRAAGAVSFVIYQAGNGNYESLTSVQKITIAKAPLTITADNKTKKAGQANPALTATYKGFVNGDDKADLTTQPKLSTTAVTSSKAGTYAITASGAASSNYAITHVAGKLVVSAATIKLNSIDEAPQPLVSQALSPNGDGSNDVLTIANINKYPNNTLTVMDVNGNSIYEAKGYDNQSKLFDGHSAKGVMQKPGTYYYLLQYKDGDEVKKLTGYILIKY